MRSFTTLSFLAVLVLHVNFIDAWRQSESRRSLYRVKRIVERPPPTTTPAPPMTSEEIREKKSGTESPHLHDYPDAVYKDPEVRKGEWVQNPNPKVTSRNVTVTRTEPEANDQPLPQPALPNTAQYSSATGSQPMVNSVLGGFV